MVRGDRLLKRLRTVIQKNISCSLVITAIVMGGLLVSCGNTEEVREGMTQYLKKTYETEFVVGKPYKRNLGVFGYDYQANVHPKDNPEVEFIIRGDRDNSGVYLEYYLPALWSYQGKKEIDKSLRNIYGELYFLDWYDFGFNNNKFKEMNHSQVITKCNGKANIKISYYVFADDPIDKKNEAKKIYKLLKTYMINNSIEKYSVNVYFLKKSLKNNPWKFRDEFKNLKSISEASEKLDRLHKEKVLIDVIYFKHIVLRKSEIKKIGVKDIIVKQTQ
jgi:hypothetical protein